MSALTTKHVKIVGLSACAPSRIEETMDLPIFASREEAEKVIASTGIARHRVCDDGVTASDLSVKAVEKLLADMNWDAASVDCLFYVCTSRDYIAPQTSCILQDRLGLRNDCFVMDLPLGCSGWVYGMSVITSMMQTGAFKRGLLIAAETNTKNRSMKDRTVRPLFGDAATVTALEYDVAWNKPMNFVFGVDGSGASAIMAKYGGTRNPVTVEALQEVEIEPGIIRRGVDMEVKGMDVFGFAIKRPPASLKELVATFNIDVNSIDYLYLHQANKFIDEKIRKSLKVPAEKVPYCLQDFGNVTCASIPLTMATQFAQSSNHPVVQSPNLSHCIACGFGVGLAWASMEFWLEALSISQLKEY